MSPPRVRQPRISSPLSTARVALALPSVYEGFGLPVLEAMKAGAPVVSSDIPPIREVAGDAALYVSRPFDPACWREALLRVSDDATLRAELVRRGHDAAQQFAWAEVGRRFSDLLHRVVPDSRRSASRAGVGVPKTCRHEAVELDESVSASLGRFRIAARAGNGLWGLCDHGLVSGVNFLTIVLVARAVTPAEFGAFVLAFTVILTTLTLQAALITRPHNVLGAVRPVTTTRTTRLPPPSCRSGSRAF